MIHFGVYSDVSTGSCDLVEYTASICFTQLTLLQAVPVFSFVFVTVQFLDIFVLYVIDYV